MTGNVLAIKLGEAQDLGSGVFTTGYRVVLSVRTIRMDVQTTTFFGDNLFQATASPWGAGNVDIGSLNEMILFHNFLKPYMGKRHEWGQFLDPPYNPSFYIGRTYTLIPPPPDPPLASGPMELIFAYYSPLKGWYCHFKGNYRLSIPIFKDFPSVEDRTPDFGIKIT